MGVTAELEVNTMTLSLFQMVGLVVEQNGELLPVCLLHEDTQGVTVYVHAVVTSDNAEVVYHCDTVLQQMDAGIVIELTCGWLATIIFVITDAGIYGGFDAQKLFVHPLFLQGAHAYIDNVTGN